MSGTPGHATISWKEHTDLTRSVDAKYGLGEGRWVLGILLECDRPNDITGGIYRLHLYPIQPHRRDHCSDPSHARNSPLHDRLPHIERRNRGDGKSVVQGVGRSFRLACTWHSPRRRLRPQRACSFREQPRGTRLNEFPVTSWERRGGASPSDPQRQVPRGRRFRQTAV